MGLMRRQHPFAGRDFMTLVPAHAVRWEDGPDGTVVALLPRFRGPVWGRLLQPRLPEARRWVRVRLDARSAALWRACDGAAPVAALVAVYQAAFPGDTDECAERVCRWTYAGYESGLLRFVNA